MKKILLIYISIILMGYTFLENSPYVEVTSLDNGTEKIYFTDEDYKYIRVENNYIINVSSHRIYGYTDVSNIKLSFDPYEVIPYYYAVDNSNETPISVKTNYYILTVDDVNLKDNNTYNDYLYVIGLCILFVLIISNINRKKGKLKW